MILALSKMCRGGMTSPSYLSACIDFKATILNKTYGRNVSASIECGKEIEDA
jgi:hypothetical protein